MYIKEKQICPAYNLKINSSCEKQIILLMIPNEEKEGWYFLAVKTKSALLRGITSKHGGFYCLKCFHYFRKEKKLKAHEEARKKKDFCGIVLPSEKDILKFTRYTKSDKMPYWHEMLIWNL